VSGDLAPPTPDELAAEYPRRRNAIVMTWAMRVLESRGVALADMHETAYDPGRRAWVIRVEERIPTPGSGRIDWAIALRIYLWHDGTTDLERVTPVASQAHRYDPRPYDIEPIRDDP